MATSTTKTGDELIRESLALVAEAERIEEEKLAALRESRVKIEAILKGANGNGNGHGPTAGGATSKPRISEQKLRLVEGYLAKRRLATQVELSKRLKINSGSVSVAVKVLEERGRARQAEEQNERSITWEIAEEPVAA